ncbi:MAG: hypothetical protein R3F20_10200 [Planctomycetota bacterium]
MIASRKSALSVVAILAFGLAFTACGTDGEDAETAGMMENESTPMAAPAAMGDQDSMIDEAAADAERRQAQVRALINRGIQAANEGRHADAKGYFRQALDYEPTNAEAALGYESMVKILNGDPNVDPAFNDQVARVLRARAKANELFREGLEDRKAGNLDAAVVKLEQSYELIKWNESPLPTDLKVAVVKRALDETRDLKDRMDRDRDQADRAKARAALAAEEERERQLLERRKRNLWDNLVEKFEQEQYKRAMHIADQIILLDNFDENAKRVREAARKADLALQRREHIDNVREETQRILEDMKMTNLPQTDTVVFPPDWSERGREPRISAEAEEISEADRAVMAKLSGTVLPKVDWSGKSMGDVVDELRAQVGVNIFQTPEARTAAEDGGELNLEFTQVSAEYALAAAVAQLGVVFKVQNGLVRIQTKEEAAKNKVVEFYDVRDLVSPIQSFPGVALNLNPSGVSLEDLEEPEEGDPNMAIDMEKLIDLIKRAVDPAWEEDAGNRLDPKNGTLIVRQTPEKQRLVRQLLGDLRKNTGIQVSIETRFIEIENNFLEDIGVDLRGLGDNSGGIGVAGPGNNRPFDDFGQAGGTGVGTPANPVGIGTGNDAGLFFSGRGGDTDIRARAENLFDEVLGDPNIIDGTGGLSFQFAYLDDVQLEAILRAVQKYERINTVTAPNLLVYNTQRANLTVLNEVSYIKDYDVEIAQASVIADPIVDKVREGTVLDVRPIVSHDRRFITLELRPTVATLVRPIRQFTTNLAVGSAVTIQLPELRKQSVSTTVVVPDQGTLLLGGLKFAQEQSLDSGVPFLKDIPILSFFFSRKGKSSLQRDVIVLLKAKIVIMDELEPTTTAP